MRIAILTRLPAVLQGITPIIRERGHEVVGVVTTEGPSGRYGDVPLSSIVDARPAGVDILVADNAKRFAPLLAALEPDLAVCGGFPVRIPADAIAVPPLGVLNGHPSPLPRYRGPNPIGWALRSGDPELGFTFHFMDADFDTGPVLLQGAAPLADAERADDVLGVLFGLWTTLLPEALARIEGGERGAEQSPEGESYAGFFEAAFVELDRARPAEEVQRQVRAWWVAAASDGVHGPLTEVDGERVRVLRSRLDDSEGGTRILCGDGRPLWIVEAAPA
jgi:methionyl-tRNA formyltransferase